MKMHRIFAVAACLALAVVVITVSSRHVAHAAAVAVPFSDGTLFTVIAAAALGVGALERKDEGGGDVALKELKKATETLLTGFEEFKKVNDQRLKEIEKKGVADPVTVEKLAKIEADMAKTEDVNQKLVAAEAQRKAQQDRIDELKAEIDKVVLRMNRPGAAARTRTSRRSSGTAGRAASSTASSPAAWAVCRKISRRRSTRRRRNGRRSTCRMTPLAAIWRRSSMSTRSSRQKPW
jgi:hypothetical protein